MASEKITLKVITPSGPALEESVESVVLKGDLGEFGVLPGHVPMVSTLIAGEIRYVSSGGEKTLMVYGGVTEVADDTVTVLTAVPESPDEIYAAAKSEKKI